jgi:hypothetical protein
MQDSGHPAAQRIWRALQGSYEGDLRAAEQRPTSGRGSTIRSDGGTETRVRDMAGDMRAALYEPGKQAEPGNHLPPIEGSANPELRDRPRGGERANPTTTEVIEETRRQERRR